MDHVEEVREGEKPAFPLTADEAAEYDGLPKSLVMKRYMKAHRSELCPHCKKFIGNHSEKKFAHCVTHETEKLRSDRALQQTLSVEPIEVTLVVCPECDVLVPPAFACIRCGSDLKQRSLILE